MSKIQNKSYLNILHILSFPKSPKTLNLDKPLKSYKQNKTRDLNKKSRDLSVMVKGPNVVKGSSASKPTKIPTRTDTDCGAKRAGCLLEADGWGRLVSDPGNKSKMTARVLR